MSSELLPVWAQTGTAVAPDSTKRSVGWTLGEKPPYEYMNWWMKEVTLRTNTILSQGPAPWAAGTTYQVNALVSRNGLIFRATAANANSAPPSANWLQVTQSATSITSGTLDRARLPAAMNPTTFQGTSTPLLTTNRTDTTINSLVEFRTTAGSVFAGQGAAGIFSVGAISNLNTVGNRRFSVDTATGNISWSGTAVGDGSTITNLNAANIQQGVLPAARLSGNYAFGRLGLSGSLTMAGGTISGFDRSVANVGGSSSDPTYGFNGTGVGAGLHMLSTGTYLDLVYANAPRLRISSSTVEVATGAMFSGNGGGLTNIAAASLTGTIANARLAGDYSFANLSLSGQISATLAQINRYEGASGSASNPTYGWLGAAGLGIYRNGGNIAFATGGTLGLQVSNNQVAVTGGRAFTGDGSGLTLLDAGAVTTGTLSDNRLPENQSYKNFRGSGVQATFERTSNSVNSAVEFRTTGGSVYAGYSSSGRFGIGASGNLSGTSVFSVDVSNGNVYWNGSATGNGGGITNLNASNLASGTLPSGRLSGTYSFSNLNLTGDLTASYVYAPRVESASGSAENPGHGFIGVTGIGMFRSGTALYLAQNGNAAISIGSAQINAGSGRIWGGNGSNLTDLNASELDSGTVPIDRFPVTSAARNWILDLNSGLTPGAVGTYAFLCCNNNVSWNKVVSGADLFPGGVAQSSGAADVRRDSSVTLGGQWRCLGFSDSSSANRNVSLFVRIS